MDLSFEGKAALVTGAASGMGLATAEAFAEAGASVALVDFNEAAVRKVAERLTAAGHKAIAIACDVTDEALVKNMVEQTVSVFGRLDAAFNNAGVQSLAVETADTTSEEFDRVKPILELTETEIADSVAVHVTGPLRLIRLLAPKMIAKRYGRIVNLSSGWGSFAEGMGGPGLYGVTKAALNALTIRLSKELPASVKVNAMCPGWVRTRMGGQGATRSPEEGADTAVWLATLPDDGPAGRFFRDRKPIDW